MLCLQQPCQSGNNISCWLNDEVLGSKIGSEDKCIVFIFCDCTAFQCYHSAYILYFLVIVRL